MQSHQTRRMFIFDPCFGGMTGHWENYCARLYQELSKRGCEVTVFGQADHQADIVRNIHFKPTFKANPFLPARNMLDLQHIADLFLADFNHIDETQFQDGDVFIFHSIYPSYFEAIIQWTEALVKKKKILSTFFFQFPPSEKKQCVGILKNEYYRFRRWLAGEKSSVPELAWCDNNQVRFYQKMIPKLSALVGRSHLLMASTDVLSRNFTALFGLKVRYLPMPGEDISDLLLQQSNKSITTTNPENKMKIGYFGHASLEKGGQFLRDLVKTTTNKYPQVDFILHINPNDETKEHLASFATESYANVTCHYGHLSQAKIMSLVNEVDIVLMPYSPIKYATTPSAIFTEAMPLKKIFVMPEGTWAYEEAVKYNAGIAPFKKYNLTSIQSSVNHAIEDFDQLSKKSRIAGDKFHQENNMINYIDVFFDHMKQFQVHYQ